MGHHTQLIGGEVLEAHLQRADWCVMDCRFDLMHPGKGRIDYETGHIPGAVHADLDRDLAAAIRPDTGRHPLPDIAVFIDTLRSWGISNDTQVVAYDGGSGALAARLWWMLRWLGHRAVAVLDGGLTAWQREGRSLSRAVPQPVPGRFSGAPDVARLVDTTEIARRLGGDGALVLVDARDADRFAGSSEPIDAVAGHIPGAINFPLARNLGADGCWRPARELRSRWEAAFGGQGPAEWAVMCGSGVTACHLALSADIAGLPTPRLYAGSWSEWIRDPERPVERGP